MIENALSGHGEKAVKIGRVVKYLPQAADPDLRHRFKHGSYHKACITGELPAGSLLWEVTT